MLTCVPRERTEETADCQVAPHISERASARHIHISGHVIYTCLSAKMQAIDGRFTMDELTNYVTQGRNVPGLSTSVSHKTDIGDVVGRYCTTYKNSIQITDWGSLKYSTDHKNNNGGRFPVEIYKMGRSYNIRIQMCI